jgi:hypothetical protein
MSHKHHFRKIFPWLLSTNTKMSQHSVSAHLLFVFKIHCKMSFFVERNPKLGANIVHQHPVKMLDRDQIINLTKSFQNSFCCSELLKIFNYKVPKLTKQ